jgi:hypothetical protein
MQNEVKVRTFTVSFLNFLSKFFISTLTFGIICKSSFFFADSGVPGMLTQHVSGGRKTLLRVLTIEQSSVQVSSLLTGIFVVDVPYCQ